MSPWPQIQFWIWTRKLQKILTQLVVGRLRVNVFIEVDEELRDVVTLSFKVCAVISKTWKNNNRFRKQKLSNECVSKWPQYCGVNYPFKKLTWVLLKYIHTLQICPPAGFQQLKENRKIWEISKIKDHFK